MIIIIIYPTLNVIYLRLLIIIGTDNKSKLSNQKTNKKKSKRKDKENKEISMVYCM